MPSFLYKPGHKFANADGFVSLEDYYAYKYYTEPDKRMTVGNKVVSLQFISDSMEPTRHMADGKYYSSKHKFRQATRAAGCVEVGNETKYVTQRAKPKLTNMDKRARREDIKKAIHELKNK